MITYALCFPIFLWASFWTWGLAKGKGKAIAMALLAKGKAKGKGKGETQEEPPRNEKEPVEKDPRAEKKMEQLRRMCRQSVKADNPENKHVSENACEKPLKKKRSRKNLEVPSETPVEPTSTRKKKQDTTAPEEAPTTEKKKKKQKEQEQQEVEETEVVEKKKKKRPTAEVAETSSPPATETQLQIEDAKEDAKPAPPKAWLWFGMWF